MKYVQSTNICLFKQILLAISYHLLVLFTTDSVKVLLFKQFPPRKGICSSRMLWSCVLCSFDWWPPVLDRATNHVWVGAIIRSGKKCGEVNQLLGIDNRLAGGQRRGVSCWCSSYLSLALASQKAGTFPGKTSGPGGSELKVQSMVL